MQAELTEGLSKPTTCIYGRLLLTQIVGLLFLSRFCECSPRRRLTFKQQQWSQVRATPISAWHVRAVVQAVEDLEGQPGVRAAASSRLLGRLGQCPSALEPTCLHHGLKQLFFLLGKQFHHFHFSFDLNDFKCINNVPYHIFSSSSLYLYILPFTNSCF